MREANGRETRGELFSDPNSEEIAGLRHRVQTLLDLAREQWEGSKLKEATNVYYDCVRVCCAAIMFSKTEEDRVFFLERLDVAAKQLPHVSEYWHKAHGAMQVAEGLFSAGKLRNALTLAEQASELNDAYAGRRRHIQGVNDLHYKAVSLEREGVRLIASPYWAALESAEPNATPDNETETADDSTPTLISAALDGGRIESASERNHSRATTNQSAPTNWRLIGAAIFLVALAVAIAWALGWL